MSGYQSRKVGKYFRVDTISSVLLRYDFKDKEVSYILKAEDEINDKFATGVLEDFVPGLKYVYKTEAFKEMEVFTNEMIEGFIRRKYKEAESTFNKGKYS
jgi:hypothetical protein